LNIIHGGVILIVYLFCVIVIFVTISGPFEDIITDIENINSTASDTHVESSGGMLRTVFNLTFAGFAIVPTVWFVYWAFHREPRWEY
jgi:Na+/proline symporter